MLAGYGAAFGATAAGHGLRVASHLITEHRATVEAVLFGTDGATRGTEHAAAHGAEHRHHGRAHSHRDAPPATPAAAPVTPDLHGVLPAATAAAELPVRSLDRGGPREAASPGSRPVEERPPQAGAGSA